MSVAWACVENRCLQDQLDFVCTHTFFQTEKHIPAQVLLPLGPCIKSSASLLLPQFKSLTFAKGQVFREVFLHAFLQVILKWLLACVLSWVVLLSPGLTMYVGFLPSSGLCIHPGAKNLNLCLDFRWALLFAGFDLIISLSASLIQSQTWKAFPSEGKLVWIREKGVS